MGPAPRPYPQPLVGQHVVSLHTAAFIVHKAQQILRGGMALFGSAKIPVRRQIVALYDTASMLILETKQSLRIRIALARPPCEHFRRWASSPLTVARGLSVNGLALRELPTSMQAIAKLTIVAGRIMVDLFQNGRNNVVSKNQPSQIAGAKKRPKGKWLVGRRDRARAHWRAP